MSITFSTCFYNFKSKFDENVYIEWMNNMLSMVNNYYLVVYTEENSLHLFEKYKSNEKIKIIVKPFENFYFYKYEKLWIENHKSNSTLSSVDWKVIMLWCEKMSFVNETIQEKYFETEMYGWCDIGYFRCRNDDLKLYQLMEWPNKEKINSLDIHKIHYACVSNNDEIFNKIKNIVLDKNEYDLPNHPLPELERSIAGGFFICHYSKLNWWLNTFESKLVAYFDHGYLVKDDQMIITNCYFLNEEHFVLHRENDSNFDNWFMFQRILL
jgi:hypothetical protein